MRPVERGGNLVTVGGAKQMKMEKLRRKIKPIRGLRPLLGVAWSMVSKIWESMQGLVGVLQCM
jgi:hypothetical protein